MSVKRLTGRKEDGHAYVIGCPEFEVPKEANTVLQSVADKCADLEDILGDTYDLDRLRELVEADKAGRCVLHPLKAEDKVYIAILGRVLPFEVVNAVWYGASPTYKAMHGMHLCFAFKQDDIRKTVFLTREAAEAALAKETDHE